MAGLTVSEKEHWKERIGKRIDKKIEVVIAADPGYMDRLQGHARLEALISLGLAELQAELDTIEAQKEELEKKERRANVAMVTKIRNAPVDDSRYSAYEHQREVELAIERRKAVHEDELLAMDERGQQILRLRQEKENLLDTVWLATSPNQIRDLWKKVSELLGEEDSPLQRQALTIGVPDNGNGGAGSTA